MILQQHSLSLFVLVTIHPPTNSLQATHNRFFILRLHNYALSLLSTCPISVKSSRKVNNRIQFHSNSKHTTQLIHFSISLSIGSSCSFSKHTSNVGACDSNSIQYTIRSLALRSSIHFKLFSIFIFIFIFIIIKSTV